MARRTVAGGLTGGENGDTPRTIRRCSANVNISTSGLAGGLIGDLECTVEQSFATGTVNGSNGSYVGELSAA